MTIKFAALGYLFGGMLLFSMLGLTYLLCLVVR